MDTSVLVLRRTAFLDEEVGGSVETTVSEREQGDNARSDLVDSRR